MALTELREIIQADLVGKLHTGLPDSPELGTLGMQQLFDAHPNFNSEVITENAQKQNANNAIIQAHLDSASNPHSVTKAQVGLGNADNTSDLDKPVSTAAQAALNLKADAATTYTKTEVDGIAGGKVDKIAGKGLSAEDYTTAEKSKLAGIAAGANNYTLPIASNSVLGGIKVGSGLEVQPDGTVNGVSAPAPDLVARQAIAEHKADIANPHGVTAAQIAAIPTTAIANNLTTTDTTKVLSAAQGVALKALATFPLTHVKSGTVHSLAGLPTAAGIYTGQFVATADYAEGDSFANSYTAKPNGEETALPDKAFVVGDVVTVAIDTTGKKLGFKLGGGTNKTLPPMIRNFAAMAGNAQITLSWQLPLLLDDYAGLLIVRKAGSAPQSPTDGDKITLGDTTAEYTDTGLENDVTYHYRAFPHNEKGQFQTELTGAVVVATPRAIPPVLEDATWEQINTVSQSGNIPTTWQVGDTKDITLSTGEVLTLQIYGFAHDDLASGGKAGITFGMKDLMSETRRMNGTDTNVGGFTNSEMYSWLQGVLYNSLPSDLKAVIKSVNKKTSAGNSSATINTDAMKIFLFSEVECFGTTTYSPAGEGTKYPIFTNNASRIKKMQNGVSVSEVWFERSPSIRNATHFCMINTVGDVNERAYFSGVCFGFCI